MWIKYVALTLAIVAIAGCTKGNDLSTPKGVLKEYVETTFALKDISEVEKLKKLTTGTAAQELDNLSKDQELFEKSFKSQKNVFQSMKIRDERKVSEDRYSITYELSYKNHTSESPLGSESPFKVQAADNEVTTKKHAIFVKENNSWRISEVQNLKTFVDHTTEEKIEVEPAKRQ